MFRKLRRIFMWVSTLVLALVIGLVTASIYWITTDTLMSQTSVLMRLILENGGDLPERSEFNAHQETFLALNIESIHEVRFFSAKETDGEVELLTTRIAELPEDNAISLVDIVLEQREDSGRITAGGKRVLHYLRQTKEDGSTMVVLVDSTSRYGLAHVILMYMVLLWLSVLALYVIVMGRYSGRLIRPFVENDERQKRFITNASHELKTPLAIISANTEMTEALGGKSKWTESTRRQIQRLQALIEDLVVLTRLDEMKEADMTDVDLSAIAAEVSESFRGVAESSGRGFDTHIVQGIHVRGDRRGLQQSVSELIDNAVKYCDEGGAITVRLEKHDHKRGICLAVSNTYREGVHVDTSRFFERFYRQDESHNSEKSGFGIGLSMAKENVERMHGKLRITNRNGTITFIMEI